MKSDYMTNFSVKFSDLFTIIGGGTPKTSVPDYWGGEIPWLSVKDFCGDRKFVYSAEKSITQLGLENSSTKLLQEGDIIVSARGTVGELAMLAAPMAFNQSCFGLRAKAGIDSHYLYYLTQTKINELKKLSHGSVFDTITRETFDKVTCKIPPLPIQRKIASILSALDDKIETNNAICRNLEKSLLTVYRNVKCASECVVKELNSLAEFSNIKKLISELNCQTYFSTENMLPGKAGAIAAASLPTTPKVTACNPGDILVSNIRPYFKKIVYCSTKCGCSSDVLCFHPKEDIYSTWLFCSLYEDDFFDYVMAGSKGTKMPRGDKAHIMRYGVAVPTRKKLEEFKATGDLVLSQINCLRSENERLNKLREVILPKLMSGELSIDIIN